MEIYYFSEKSKEELLDIMEIGLNREENLSNSLPMSRLGLHDARNTLKIMREAPVVIIFGSVEFWLCFHMFEFTPLVQSEHDLLALYLFEFSQINQSFLVEFFNKLYSANAYCDFRIPQKI